jgi:alpha-glucosidase
LTLEFEATTALSFNLFAGQTPAEVLDAYTALTGRPFLPPFWALGYHQSRYGYLSDREVRQVVRQLRKSHLPSDAIWLDIDYQDENAPFTVNTEAFPDLPAMVGDFQAIGMHTVVITDPHIKSYQDARTETDYAPYSLGASGDHFIRDAGGKYFEGKVWPGMSVFPEFTLSRTRNYWGKLYAEFVSMGIDGFWNDMNEPALFVESKTMPTDLRHRLEGGGSAPHTVVHNAYGTLNARATYEGLLELSPDKRPFVLTRAAAAGARRGQHI